MRLSGSAGGDGDEHLLAAFEDILPGQAEG